VPTPGFGEEGRDAGAAGADAFGQGALRVELKLQLAREVEFLEEFVLADIGRDHLLDLAALQQHAEAKAVDPAVVGDHRQPLGPALADRRDQVFRDTAEAKAPGHDGHAIEQPPRQGVDGGFLCLVSHPCPLRRTATFGNRPRGIRVHKSENAGA
jgi:hypothetical protein